MNFVPRPASASLLLAAFDDVERAGSAVAAIIAAGIVPGGLEMMDNPALRAAEDFVHAGYPVDAAALLLCGFSAQSDALLEIGVGRGDYADVHPLGPRVPNRHDLALLEEAEQLGLHLERQVAALDEPDAAKRAARLTSVPRAIASVR